MTNVETIVVVVLLCFCAVLCAKADGARWASKRVLIVGDSLVGEGSGLEIGLRKSLEADGAIVVTMAEIGGRASSLAKSKDLREKLSSWRPDTVVLSLGMNSCRTTSNTYARHARAISARLKGIECYWVGPPLLVEGVAGFVIALPEIVQENSHCKYFNTMEEVSFPMGSVSGFHVRRWKGKRWAKQVWEWINK